MRLTGFPGTVTEYNIQDYNEEPQYEEDDPRSWRNQCEGETQPLAALLDDWKDKYYTLKWMGFAMNGWPTIMWADRGDENYEEVKVSLPQMRSAHHAVQTNELSQSKCARLSAKMDGQIHSTGKPANRLWLNGISRNRSDMSLRKRNGSILMQLISTYYLHLPCTRRRIGSQMKEIRIFGLNQTSQQSRVP
jgi:hypothetical protein